MAENSPSQQNLFHPLRWEDWLAALAMGLLAVITFANVLVRYLTDQSFAWTEEYSTALMLILTMAATGAAVTRDRHIRIELLFSTGSAGRRRVMAIVSALASLAAFGILTGLAVKFAYDDFQYDVTSPGIGLPQWWYSIWLPLLGLAICIRALMHLIRVWRSV